MCGGGGDIFISQGRVGSDSHQGKVEMSTKTTSRRKLDVYQVKEINFKRSKIRSMGRCRNLSPQGRVRAQSQMQMLMVLSKAYHFQYVPLV